MTSHLQKIAEYLGDDGAKYKCQDHLLNNIIADIQSLQRRARSAEKAPRDLHGNVIEKPEVVVDDKGQPPADKAHLSLRLDVTYDLDGDSKENMIANLDHFARFLIGEGLLTGVSPATVDSWKASIIEREFNVNGEELSDNDRAEIELGRRKFFESAYADLKKAYKGVLRIEGEENDYVMEEETGVWIRHKNLVAYIRASEDGLAVDITPSVCADETLDCCYTEFEAAKDLECPTCGKYNNDGEGYDGYCGDCADRREKDE